MDKQTIWSFADEGYIRCTVQPMQQHDQQWLAAIRIYYVLSGYMNLRIGTHSYRLGPDDLIIVNKHELFAITDCDGLAAIYDLDSSHVEPSGQELWFNFNPSSDEDIDAVLVLKEFLARFIKFNLDIEADKTYLNRSLYYAIMHHLISFFRITKPEHSLSGSDMLDRVEQIARYIDSNYRKPLKLEDLSNHFYLSVPYMSKLFKRHFGTTFSEYLTNIRLQSSLPELQFGEKTLEAISEECGFASSRSYISFFRKKYDITPGEYRRRLQQKDPTSGSMLPHAPEVAQTNKLGLLARYLESDTITEANASTLPIRLTEIPDCQTKKSGTPLRHNFQKMTSIGRASDLLSAENQIMLRTMQQEVGFEYIIFHGLFDDDMMVYGEDHRGEPELNFGYIDLAFDFLQSIGLRPFVEFSYMPRLLAKTPERLTNSGRSCISLPKDMRKWEILVERFMRHINDRYGIHEVKKWPFTLWNAPDSGESIFGLGSVEDYFEFYKHTYGIVKALNPEAPVSGPSCLTETAEDGSYLPEFLTLCKKHHCLPDSLQYHFYPVRAELPQGENVRTEFHLTYRTSPDALRESLRKVRSNMLQWPGGIQTLCVSEWNATISHRELLSDTAFQAAYIVKNVLENLEGADCLSYWTLSDSINEVRLTSNLYHGGLGLFTYNGIKKASYHAFRLLSKLGDTLLDSGDGYCITRSEKGWQIMLYNYQHYSKLYADGELFDMTFLSRYTPFANPTRKKFSLTLADLHRGNYLITETILSPEHGSSFDKWVEQGALPLGSKEDFDYLQSASVPKMQKRITFAKEGKIDLSLTLDPHEVRLVEICPSSDY